jgi:UDP-N-acetylmuramoylalanine--D-glutamate ligase
VKIAIIGFGKQGRSAYDYWKTGNEITVCDNDEFLHLPHDVTAKLGKGYLNDLGGFDLVVRSPGIHPSLIEEANGKDILDKVSTVTNEFFRVCPSKNIIGVTGTKGKGTTSTLIAKMLASAGKNVHLGGNIGTPPLDMLNGAGDLNESAARSIQKDDYVVLELASQQLIDFKYAPKIGVCLMIAPEHLNWHTDLDDYFTAKKQLFARQGTDDTAIYYAKNDYSHDIAAVSAGNLIPYYAPPGAIVENDDIVIDGQSICSTDEIELPGAHNWQNVCAAVTAVWQITQDTQAIRKALITFAGMENRLELVRELDGVRYYNDSFGTAPETAIVAVQAFEEPKVVILGGSDKGASYDELAEVVAENNIRRVLLIGEQGGRIRKALDKAGFSNYMPGGTDIEEIVDTARRESRPGDVVLLSPACASFDMFKSYADRGEKFRTTVLKLG